MYRKYCDPEGFSEVLYTEQLKDLDDSDIVVFQRDHGDSICMSKTELLEFWNQETGWNWGNCVDNNGIPVSDEIVDLGNEEIAEKFCNKYYKIPATNQYISDAMKQALEDSNTLIWVIKDNGIIRQIGRNIHYESEYNNPNEKIYSLCEDSGDCKYTEKDVEREIIEQPDRAFIRWLRNTFKGLMKYVSEIIETMNPPFTGTEDIFVENMEPISEILEKYYYYNKEGPDGPNIDEETSQAITKIIMESLWERIDFDDINVDTYDYVKRVVDAIIINSEVASSS